MRGRKGLQANSSRNSVSERGRRGYHFPRSRTPRVRTMSDAATGLLYSPPPADMPIPNRLNGALVALVFAAAVGLLWLGSWVERWYAVLGVGAAFSFVLLTNYALLHEATHGNLHSDA